MRHGVLVVNDAAAGEHPLQVAGAEHAFVLIVDLALEQEGGDLESGVRMLTADRDAIGHVDAIVHEDDERILLGEPRRIDDGHRRVARAGKAGRGGGVVTVRAMPRRTG